MTTETNTDDLVLVSASKATLGELLDLEGRAFLGMRARRAFERQVDTLRHAAEGRELPAADAVVLGAYLEMLGLHREALEILERHESHDISRYFRGRALRELGRYRLAIQALVPVASKHPMAAIELVESQVGLGQIDAAAALAAKPPAGTTPAQASYLRGVVADAQGEYSQATDHYEAAIAADPNFQRATFRLAFDLDLRGDEERARALYEELTEAQPPHVNALINLGIIYEDMGDYPAAAECYQRVLEVYPAHERARLFLKDAQASVFELVDEDRERRHDEVSQKLRTPITDFELSVRSRNCLAKLGIRTLGDLVQHSEAELLSYKNFGETSLQEIKEILSAKNLRLGMKVDAGAPRAFALPGAEATVPPGVDEEVLERPVDQLELSVRSRKAMERLQVLTVGDLIKLSENQLLSQKNFGLTSLNEIKSLLGQLGLKLAEG